MNDNFAKWFREHATYSESYDDARMAWIESIQSLEVTPELVEIGFAATHERSQTTRRDIEKALTTVFNAIKEQAK